MAKQKSSLGSEELAKGERKNVEIETKTVAAVRKKSMINCLATIKKGLVCGAR